MNCVFKDKLFEVWTRTKQRKGVFIVKRDGFELARVDYLDTAIRLIREKQQAEKRATLHEAKEWVDDLHRKLTAS